jgi:Na+/glutamate symporter
MVAVSVRGCRVLSIATMSRLYRMMGSISFMAVSIVAAESVDGQISSTESGTTMENLSEEFTPAPTPLAVSADVVHEDDALAALAMNVIIILCLLAAYYVKHFRYHHIPESTISLMVGVVVGGIVRLTTDNMQLWEFVSDLYSDCALD